MADGERPLVRPGLVAVFGEVFLDLVFAGLNAPPELGIEVFGDRFSLAPGGSAITAITLARLGQACVLATTVGEDVLSDILLRTLAGEGVGVEGAERYPDGLSITISASAASDRALITHMGAEPKSALEDACETALRRQPSHVHLGAGHPMAERIRGWAHEAGATVSLGVGWDPDFLRSEQLIRSLDGADLVAFNEREALTASGASTALDAAFMLAKHARAVLVTRGAEGAVLVHGDVPYAVAAPHARAVDTTGAGDVFLATLVAALARGFTDNAALEAASRIAGRAIERLGGASGVPRGPLRSHGPRSSTRPRP